MLIATSGLATRCGTGLAYLRQMLIHLPRPALWWEALDLDAPHDTPPPLAEGAFGAGYWLQRRQLDAMARSVMEGR